MQTAPWSTVADREIVSVEHPGVVRNVDKAMAMLGDQQILSELVHNENPISLNFHPEDATARPIVSINAHSNNVLLKITVPKRTGRKRKRGSIEPFTQDRCAESCSNPKAATYLLQSLQDNPMAYEVEGAGTIRTTHLWRAMPDFVYSTSFSPFLNDMRSKILPMSYPDLKTWKPSNAMGLESTEIIPPPIFSSHTVPHIYAYRQNPAVKTIIDPQTGARTLYNTQTPMRVFTHQVYYDTPVYPSSPPSEAPPLNTMPPNFQDLAATLATHFSQRPIWTRRALLNQLPSNAPLFLARYALAYVAFAIRSGPWRDTYVSLGLDPRTDPKYRKYQAVFVQLIPSRNLSVARAPLTPAEIAAYATAADYARVWSKGTDSNSHIFTGTGRVPPDGKIWQLCDLVDPHLKSLVDIPDLHIRPVCETRCFGWYSNGTLAKMRILLKAKTDALMNNTTLLALGFTEEKLARFLALPESWDGEQAAVLRGGMKADPTTSGFLPKEGATSLELKWASAYRGMCRAKEGSMPTMSGGRLSKRKTKQNPRRSFVPREEDKGREMSDMESAVGRGTESEVGDDGPSRAAESELRGGSQTITDEQDEGLEEFQEPEEGDDGFDGDDDGDMEMVVDTAGNFTQLGRFAQADGGDDDPDVEVARDEHIDT